MYKEPYEARLTSRGCKNWIASVITSAKTKEQAKTALKLAVNFSNIPFPAENNTLNALDCLFVLDLALEKLKQFK